MSSRMAYSNDKPKTRAATIITTQAAGAAAHLHDRMPVVLPDTKRQAA